MISPVIASLCTAAEEDEDFHRCAAVNGVARASGRRPSWRVGRKPAERTRNAVRIVLDGCYLVISFDAVARYIEADIGKHWAKDD